MIDEIILVGFDEFSEWEIKERIEFLFFSGGFVFILYELLGEVGERGDGIIFFLEEIGVTDSGDEWGKFLVLDMFWFKGFIDFDCACEDDVEFVSLVSCLEEECARVVFF